jgi:hypothetical protein
MIKIESSVSVVAAVFAVTYKSSPATRPRNDVGVAEPGWLFGFVTSLYRGTPLLLSDIRFDHCEVLTKMLRANGFARPAVAA